MNGFQQMMRFWEKFHAVNAVQYAELNHSIDLLDLKTAAESCLAEYESNDPSGSWRCGDSSTDVSLGEIFNPEIPRFHSVSEVEDFISGLMNMKFSRTTMPIRLGMFSFNGVAVVWLCYRHVIADARSVAQLLHRILDESRKVSRAEPHGNHSTSKVTFLANTPSVRRSFVSRIKAVFKAACQLPRCARPLPSRYDTTMRYMIHGRDLSVARLRRNAESYGATVGEVFSASLQEWLGRFCCSVRKRPLANSTCIGVLADMTSRSAKIDGTAFGQSICPFMLYGDHSLSYSERIKCISDQLRGKDQFTTAVQNLHNMNLVVEGLQHVPRSAAVFLQDIMFPIAGAVSNVNLNAVLPQDDREAIVGSYFRSTCATQFSPVIVCLTTCEDSCTLTSTHFPSYYPDEAIRELGQHLLNQMFGQDPRTFESPDVLKESSLGCREEVVSHKGWESSLTGLNSEADLYQRTSVS
jgi:plasmid stabilization system protein ParE